MLQELSSHTTSSECTPTILRDKQTLKYLKALNMMFERGILSKAKVETMENEQLILIGQGFQFFSDWCEEVIREGINPDDPSQKPFLAWQVCHCEYNIMYVL